MIRLELLCREVKCTDMRLIAGKNGLNKPVRWVHMVESPEISSFLNGNEVVFVTGAGLNPLFTLFDLVQSIQQNNASAVVINLGPYIAEIPSQVIEFCEEHALALFSVPWKVQMAEIMRAFCMKIMTLEKQSMHLTQAVKNAIYFPNQVSAYLPFLEASGLRSNARYCLGIVELFQKRNQTADFPLRLLQLKSFVDALAFNAACKIHAFLFEDYCVLLFINASAETIRAFFKTIRSVSAKFLKGDERLYIAFGAQQKEAQALHRSYRQAKQALQLQKKLGSPNEIGAYEDLGLYRLLLAIEDKAALKKFLDETLGNLLKYDLLHKTNYCRVLEIYLQKNGSIKQTANALYMHRNTAIYQIHKIEEILHCNLSELKTRAFCYLALLIKNLL